MVDQPHDARLGAVRAAMAELGVDVVLLSVGADLPWLCGYEAMPLERLTMLVVPRDGTPVLVVPGLEEPRVDDATRAVVEVRPWAETEDPVAVVTQLCAGAARAALGDRTWSRFTLALQERLPSTAFVDASTVIAPLRARKDVAEIEALRAAAAAADRVAGQLQAGEVALAGRSEAQVSDELGRRLVAEGHQRVNFAIVAAGPNAASPHHEPGPTVIGPGDLVLCDFGGTLDGYCSDMTRMVSLGPPSAEVVEAYAALHTAQAAAVAGAVVGRTCAEVDAIARDHLAAAGFGERFIHRVGHGIGTEAHEDPYLVAGNDTALAPGHAFSIEPGIYTPGRWGMRLEDIVVATTDGPDPLNRADHAIAVIDG